MKNIRLEYYINLFLKNSKIRNKESTYSNYCYLVNKRILPYFKNIKVNGVNNELVINYVNYLINSNLSSKSIKDIICILKSIFKLGGIGIEIPIPKINKKDILVYSDEDQLKLEKYLLSNINLINMGIYLCLYTGLRIGELCALRWENIDLDNNKIYIKNTLVRVRSDELYKKTKIVLESPKSNNSYRVIPIPYFLIRFLRDFKGLSNNSYFLTGTDRFIEPRALYNRYKCILKELDIDKYTFHSLRHTFATRCISNGCDPKTLSLILGHASVNITLNRYVHPSYEDKVRFMDSLKPMV